MKASLNISASFQSRPKLERNLSSNMTTNRVGWLHATVHYIVMSHNVRNSLQIYKDCKITLLWSCQEDYQNSQKSTPAPQATKFYWEIAQSPLFSRFFFQYHSNFNQCCHCWSNKTLGNHNFWNVYCKSWAKFLTKIAFQWFERKTYP